MINEEMDNGDTAAPPADELLQRLTDFFNDCVVSSADSIQDRDLSRNRLEAFLNEYSFRVSREVETLINTEMIDNMTVLQVAARYGRDDLIGLLVQYGARVNYYNDDGDTALHIAIYNRQPDVISALLANGANPYARPYGDFSAVEAARLLHEDAILALFRDSSAHITNDGTLGSRILGYDASGRVITVAEEIRRQLSYLDQNSSATDDAYVSEDSRSEHEILGNTAPMTDVLHSASRF